MDKNTFTKQDSMRIKGIAVILLMFYHCFVSDKVFTKYEIAFFPLTKGIAGVFTDYFKICVPIFAFISGYGLYKSFSQIVPERKEIEKWTMTRIWKLMSGFWFVLVCTWALCQIIDGMPQKVYFEEGGVRGILYMLLEATGFARLFGGKVFTVTWWYIGAAVFFILLVPLLMAAVRHVGWGITCALIILLPRIFLVGFPGSMNPYSFLMAFAGGMIFSEMGLFEKLDKICLVKNKKTDGAIQFLIALGILLASILVYERMTWKVVWEIPFMVCPVIFFCFCRKYVIHIPVLKDILWYLGKHSMNMFLIHSIIKNRYLSEFLYSFRYYWLIPFVLLAISLVFSIVLEWVKKAVRYDAGMNKLLTYLVRMI